MISFLFQSNNGGLQLAWCTSGVDRGLLKVDQATTRHHQCISHSLYMLLDNLGALANFLDELVFEV